MNRTERLHIRVTPEEIKLIQRAAKVKDMTVSSLVLKVMMQVCPGVVEMEQSPED